MARCAIVKDSDGRLYGIKFFCPGCALIRGYGPASVILPVRWLPPGMETSPILASHDHWDFNGDFDRPVFGPSVLSRQRMHEPPVGPNNIEQWRAQPWEQHEVHHICHSFIGCNGAAPGQIIFLNDCTHALAGKTVDLPEIDPPQYKRFSLSDLQGDNHD